MPKIKSTPEKKPSNDYQDYYEDDDSSSEDGYIPIIVIRHQGTTFPSFLGSLFGNRGPFGMFGSDDSFETDKDYPIEKQPQFPGFSQQPPPSDSLCGLLCTILKGFQIHDDSTTTDGDYDINNTTYTEKVKSLGIIVQQAFIEHILGFARWNGSQSEQNSNI